MFYVTFSLAGRGFDGFEQLGVCETWEQVRNTIINYLSEEEVEDFLPYIPEHVNETDEPHYTTKTGLKVWDCGYDEAAFEVTTERYLTEEDMG